MRDEFPRRPERKEGATHLNKLRRFGTRRPGARPGPSQLEPGKKSARPGFGSGAVRGRRITGSGCSRDINLSLSVYINCPRGMVSSGCNVTVNLHLMNRTVYETINNCHPIIFFVTIPLVYDFPISTKFRSYKVTGRDGRVHELIMPSHSKFKIV